VFRQPQVQTVYARLQVEIHGLFQKKDVDAAEKKCREAIRMAPQYADAHYNLACAFARQDKKQEALDSLARAVERGFNNPRHIKEDSDLESLREEARFKKLVADAAKAKPLALWPAQIEAGKPKDGEVWVTEKNTTWDLRQGGFRTLFDIGPLEKDREIVKGFGEAGDLLRKWFKEGTAAGNHGDLYDNHDADHSNMSYQSFPQLTRIEFSKEAQAARVHTGLQSLFLYNGVVLGNSSTAIVGGPLWRSQPRLRAAPPRTGALQPVCRQSSVRLSRAPRSRSGPQRQGRWLRRRLSGQYAVCHHLAGIVWLRHRLPQRGRLHARRLSARDEEETRAERHP